MSVKQALFVSSWHKGNPLDDAETWLLLLAWGTFSEEELWVALFEDIAAEFTDVDNLDNDTPEAAPCADGGLRVDDELLEDTGVDDALGIEFLAGGARFCCSLVPALWFLLRDTPALWCLLCDTFECGVLVISGVTGRCLDCPESWRLGPWEVWGLCSLDWSTRMSSKSVPQASGSFVSDGFPHRPPSSCGDLMPLAAGVPCFGVALGVTGTLPEGVLGEVFAPLLGVFWLVEDLLQPSGGNTCTKLLGVMLR